MFNPGENPREHIKHRERGPVLYVFSLKDIANATGLSYSTIKRKKSIGEFDPTNLVSVCEFVVAQRLLHKHEENGPA